MRNFLQFCYLCAQFFDSEESWLAHCQYHLDDLQPRCGLLRFRYTIVAPGFCPFCLGDPSKRPDERFSQWMTKPTLLNHIDTHLNDMNSSIALGCPHPCCENKEYENHSHLRRHFLDFHSIEEPRSNCVIRKRKWTSEEDFSLNNQDTKSRHRRRLNNGPAHAEVNVDSSLIDPSLHEDLEANAIDEMMEEFLCSDVFE